MTFKTFIFYICIASIVLFSNCECFRSCDPGPFFGDLELKLTVNSENTEVPIEIYEGEYDKGILIIQDTVASNELENGKFVYNLEAGFYYAAAAIYKDGAKTLIAIDGDELSIETDDCDCSYPSNRTLNLRLAK